MRTLELYPFDARLGNALVSGVTYVSKMIWPRSLSFYYPFPAIPWPWWVVLGSGAILAVVTFIALRQASRQPFLAFGWAWYLLTLVPVIGLVQVGDQAMADRYTYVPLIGLFVLVAWGGATLLWTAARPFPAAAWIVPAGVLVGLSLAARQQLSYWKDDITLIGRAIEVTAGNVLAHNNLGNALMRERRTGEAIAHYTEALRLRPDYTLAHYNLANALRDERRTQEALDHYREALRLDPGYLPPRNNMGLILNALGRTAEAEIVFRQGLAIDPGAADICNNLGLLLLEGGRVEESLDLFVRAVQAQPSNGNSRRNLAAALERLGRTREAAGHYREALLVNPGDVEARFRLERLSRLPARD